MMDPSLARPAIESWGVAGIVRDLRDARRAFDGARRHAVGHAPLPSRDALAHSRVTQAQVRSEVFEDGSGI